jgi:hypothetical protein
MDPSALTTLATQVVAILAPLVPFLSTAANAIAPKVGEDAYAEVKHLYGVIHTRFDKEADDGKSSKVLQNFAEDPEEYAPNLENKLLQVLQADPSFANTLNQIIKTGPLQEMIFGDESSIEDTHQTNEQEQGTQSMKGGKSVTFKNVSQTIGHKKEQK